jgi:surfeit locus 1 family protein
MRLPFRPAFWPTLFSLPAILVMVGLSLWQIQRLEEKRATIAERQTRVDAPMIAIPPAGADLAALEFRRVPVRGAFDHGHELYMPARSQNGNVGYWIVTPFLPADGSPALIVNRGWVPMDMKDPALRQPGQIAGEIELEAILRLPKDKNWFQPENEPLKNEWFYLAPSAMAAHLDLSARTDFYLDAVKSDIPGTYPLGGQTRVQLPNDHLQYAITWAMLAVALCVIYVVWHLKRDRSQRP